MGDIEIGHEGSIEARVDQTMTAAAIGSGAVEGLSTPSMIALMEAAAIRAVGDVPEGHVSVGTHIDVRHLAPTPVGMRVVAKAVVSEVEGRRVVFSLTASDEAGPIGEGTHERYIVRLEGFVERLRDRAGSRT